MKKKIFLLHLLFLPVLIMNSQGIKLLLNGDTTPVNKIDCWSFNKMDVVFDYNKKVTSGEMCGIVLSVENKYNTLHFLGELNLKEVKKEGTKNNRVEVSVFKTDDVWEETNFIAISTRYLLTHGALYYEPGEKGNDTTWLSISVVTRQKDKKAGQAQSDKDNDDEKEPEGESVGMYDVVVGPKKIMMLNRSWVDAREWAHSPDIAYPAGDCKNIRQQKIADGVWSRKNEKGDMVVCGTYKSNLRQGTWYRYSEDGKFLREVKKYSDGVANGNCKRYNYEGVISEMGAYRNGKRHGTWFTFTNYGNPEYVYEYNIGELVTLPSEINALVKTMGRRDVDSKKQGPWVESSLSFFDSCFYKNDLKNGIAVKYIDGILSKVNTYKAGEDEGPRYEYSEKGILKSEVWYSKGEKNGIYREFSDGCLQEEGAFLNGKRNGVWKKYICGDYYQTEEITWKDDEMTGPFKYYFKNGKIKSEGIFKNGEYEGQYKDYFDNGKLSEEGAYKNGQRTGIWKFYSSSGELHETKTY